MLDIGEVSKLSGQPPSTLRYYEEKGLITSNGRNGIRRTFADSVLERLALIGLGRAAGFSLDEIKRIFRGRRGVQINRNRLLAKANELDEQIQRLTDVRDALRNTAACPAKHHLDCPNFQRAMVLARRGEYEPLFGDRRTRTG